MKQIILFTFLVFLTNICFASFPIKKSQTEILENSITIQSIYKTHNKSISQQNNFFKSSLKFF